MWLPKTERAWYPETRSRGRKLTYDSPVRSGTQRAHVSTRPMPRCRPSVQDLHSRRPIRVTVPRAWRGNRALRHGWGVRSCRYPAWKPTYQFRAVRVSVVGLRDNVVVGVALRLAGASQPPPCCSTAGAGHAVRPLVGKAALPSSCVSTDRHIRRGSGVGGEVGQGRIGEGMRRQPGCPEGRT